LAILRFRSATIVVPPAEGFFDPLAQPLSQPLLVPKCGRAAMTALARTRRPRELAAEAFALYEAFRPVIPEGVKGCGAKEALKLRQIRSLAKA
jgi:hypothetical protein